MNKTQKENIVAMKAMGCTHRQIAEVLDVKESTIKKYCYRHGIKLPEDNDSQRRKTVHKWKVCSFCGKAYIDNLTEREYCSDTCRTNLWREEQKRKEAIRKEKEAAIREEERKEALKKELDFLAKKSNELIAQNGWAIGYRRE